MRRVAPARLYLRRARADRGAVWVIKDHGRETSTGCLVDDRTGAETALRAYLKRAGIEWNGSKFVDLTRRPTGFLYFITTTEVPDYPIKIGYTDKPDVAIRMRQLQNGNPHKLVLITSGPGRMEDEQQFLKSFAHLRMQSEWLKRSNELILTIGQWRGHAPVTLGQTGANWPESDQTAP